MLRWTKDGSEKKTKTKNNATICWLPVHPLHLCVREWLHTLLSPVVWRLRRKSSQPVLSRHVQGCLLCPVGGTGPRAALIGVKRAALKSHQCPEMLSQTGNLLLGDFRQLLDSVCPCLFHCLSQYPSLLKSLITLQFPSALFLYRSLSVGFKHWLFITPPPPLMPSPSLLLPLSVSAIVFMSTMRPWVIKRVCLRGTPITTEEHQTSQANDESISCTHTHTHAHMRVIV